MFVFKDSTCHPPDRSRETSLNQFVTLLTIKCLWHCLKLKS